MGRSPQHARIATKAVAVVLASIVAVTATAACGRSSAGAPVVVASIYPLVDAARAIAGEAVAVEGLAPGAGEAHDLELTPGQVATIDDAALLLYVGGGFQPAVERAGRRAQRRVDVLRVAAPEDGDPHVWLDPQRMASIADAVGDALASIDARNRDRYLAAARRRRAALERLDRDFAAGLRQCQRRTLVTAHDSFGYLARRYGLDAVAITGRSPEAEPGPGRVRELIDLVRSTGTTTIFGEPASSRLARALARETGATVAVLDPLEVEPQNGGGYLAAMRRNLERLRAALACS